MSAGSQQLACAIIAGLQEGAAMSSWDLITAHEPGTAPPAPGYPYAMTLPPGIYTPAEAATAMEAGARSAADEHDALKRSVATLQAQVALLMNTALASGGTSINAVRATLGLPAFPEDP